MSQSRSDRPRLRPRAVIFDFYGTIARAVTWGPRFEEVFARRGLELSPAAHEAWRAEVFDGLEHGEHSVSRERYLSWERARLGRLVTVAGVTAGASDIESLIAELHAATQAFELEAYPEAPSVLDELRDAGLSLAVCSNWGWDLDEALHQAGLSGYFDVAVTSAQVGARKPHPKIFAETLARVGVASQDSIFVGDTWYPDVEGAAAAGMRPVHVWRTDAPLDVEPPPLSEGVERVPDLTGLLAFV